MLIYQDWKDISPSELGSIFLSDGYERNGTFYTSDADIDRILDNLVFTSVKPGTLSRAIFLDPSAGCGSFLVRTARRLSDAELSCGIPHGCSWVRENRFCGIEIDPDAAQVARTALFIQLRICEMRFAECVSSLEAISLEVPETDILHISIKEYNKAMGHD